MSEDPSTTDLSIEQIQKAFPDNYKAFKTLLSEKNVQPFSTFDKFLPLLIYDKRFTVIPQSLRKSLFEHLVKNHATEFEKPKQTDKKSAQEALKALLDEYEKIGGYLKKPSYSDFKAHFHNDTRLTDALKFYDMEKFFNAKLENFQKDLKDEKAAGKFQFMEMIREYFRNEKGKIDRALKWDAVKKELKKDKRYDLVSSSTDRERIFEDILRETLHSKKERDRSRSRDRERKSGKDDRNRMIKGNEDSSTRVEKMKRIEAMEKYEVLLAEKIKTYDIKFRDADDQLKKDPRYENISLDRDIREELFDKFAENKRQEALKVFHQILVEKKFEIEPDMRFDDARKIFENDRRYNLRSKDAKRRFEDFMEDLRDETFENFKTFINETPLIHKDKPIEGEEFELLLEKLSEDFRYQRMEYRKEKRERMIKEKILALKEEYIKKHPEMVEEDGEVILNIPKDL